MMVRDESSWLRAVAIAASLFGCALLADCSPASTGVDVVVEGADQIGGDQVQIFGGIVTTIDGVDSVTASRMALLPALPRPLVTPEDLWVVFPDAPGDGKVAVNVQILKGGQPAGPPQTKNALLSPHITKRVCFCFSLSGACPNSPCAD